MKRIKRKYTRHELDGVQLKPFKAVALILPPETIEADIAGIVTAGIPSKVPYYQVRDFSFDDLPLSIRQGVENTIKLRKRLGLPDDSKERKEKAIRMFRGDRLR